MVSETAKTTNITVGSRERSSERSKETTAATNNIKHTKTERTDERNDDKEQTAATLSAHINKETSCKGQREKKETRGRTTTNKHNRMRNT